MRLLEFYLKEEIAELNKSNVRLAAVGRVHELPDSAQKQLEKSIVALKKKHGPDARAGLELRGRAEIVDAVRSICSEVKSGRLDTADVDEKSSRSTCIHAQYPTRIYDSNQRRDARQQFSVVADFLRGDLRHGNTLARFSEDAYLKALEDYSGPKPSFWPGQPDRNNVSTMPRNSEVVTSVPADRMARRHCRHREVVSCGD